MELVVAVVANAAVYDGRIGSCEFSDGDVLWGEEEGELGGVEELCCM